jgi:hypothetical protein
VACHGRLLRVARASPARHPTRSSGVPQAGPPAAPRRQPGRSRCRGPLQAGRRGVRGPLRPRPAPPATTGSARQRPGWGDPFPGFGGGGSATSSRPSSTGSGFGGGGRPGWSPAGRRSRGRRRSSSSRTPSSAPGRRHGAHRGGRATTARPPVPTPGTQARASAVSAAAPGQVRQVRQSILGQMVTAGPCPRCGGGHRRHRTLHHCGARAAGSRSAPTPSTSPPASTRLHAAPERLRERSGPGAGRPATSTSRSGWPDDPLRPPRRRPRPRRVAATQAALGATVGFDTLDGTES